MTLMWIEFSGVSGAIKEADLLSSARQENNNQV